MGSRDRAAVGRQMGELLGTTDVLASVIRSDRHRGGRAGEESPPTDNVAATPEALSVRTPYDRQAELPPAGGADPPTALPAGLPVTVADGKRRPAGRTRLGMPGQRVEEACQLAHSATVTVTLRVPRGLNEWLDEYVHRSWPRRVRKQELVAEALRLLFARRGRPGEPVLRTDLLPADEP